MFGRWKNEAPKNSFWVWKSLRPVIVCFVRFRRFGCETRPIICLHSLDCEQASEGDGTSEPLYQDLIYFPKQFSVFFCLRKCRGSKIAIFTWNGKCASMPWLSGDHLRAWCLCDKEKKGALNYCWDSPRTPRSLAKGVWSVITRLFDQARKLSYRTLNRWPCCSQSGGFDKKNPPQKKHRVDNLVDLLLNLFFFFFPSSKGGKEGYKLQIQDWAWRSGTAKRLKG